MDILPLVRISRLLPFGRWLLDCPFSARTCVSRVPDSSSFGSLGKLEHPSSRRDAKSDSR